MPRRACALALLVLFSATPEAGQKTKPPAPPPPVAPLDLPRLLDLYAAGRFDEAVRSVAQVGDEIGQRLRRHWDVTGRQWIDADLEHRPQRILVAAALALETEHIRAERGEWRVAEGDPPCTASCVLDWAQSQLVQRGAPDRAERAWYLAAAALAGGDRDWRYLQRPVRPGRAPEVMPALMDRALARFPGDASLRLDQAIAAAGRFNVLADGGRLAPAIQLPSILVGRGISAATLGLDPNAPAGMLTALVDDPLVGPEARLRLGYLYWAQRRDEIARDELAKAPNGREMRTSATSRSSSSDGSRSSAATPPARSRGWKRRSPRGPRPNQRRWRSPHSSSSVATPTRRTRSRRPRSIGVRMWIRGGCSFTGTIPACPRASPSSAGR